MSGAVLALPFTRARLAAAEEKAAAAVEALASAVHGAGAGALRGVALGGPHAAGEAATLRLHGGPEAAEPFEIFAFVDAAPRRAEAARRLLARALHDTAKGHRVEARLRVLPAGATRSLPPSASLAELAAFGRVLSGPEDLLFDLPSADRPLPLVEGVRLLVASGARLLSAERAVAGARVAPADAARALAAVRRVDLALGAVLLVAAGRFVPGEDARDAALRDLAAPSDAPAAPGLKARLSWTRFRDLVDRHRVALSARALLDPEAADDVRKLSARAADRWMEVLRLLEEERLHAPVPDWATHARLLAARHEPKAAPPLFGPPGGEPAVTRRGAASWPLVERLAPALAALLDWDPADLPVAAPLLGLADGATREQLAARAIAQAAEV